MGGGAVNVLILGAGLVGSSLGLALTKAGYGVRLWDIVASHTLVAAGLGAGEVSDEATDDPDIVVVATPPHAIAGLVAEVLGKFPRAVITDVGSVKAPSSRLSPNLPRNEHATSAPTRWPAPSSPAP